MLYAFVVLFENVIEPARSLGGLRFPPSLAERFVDPAGIVRDPLMLGRFSRRGTRFFVRDLRGGGRFHNPTVFLFDPCVVAVHSIQVGCIEKD